MASGSGPASSTIRAACPATSASSCPGNRRTRTPRLAEQEPELMSLPTKDPSAPRHAKYDRLIAVAREVPAIPTVVAYPCDAASLTGVVEAAAAKLVEPILVGPK